MHTQLHTLLLLHPLLCALAAGVVNLHRPKSAEVVTKPTCFLFPKDATISLSPTELTVDEEGPDPDTVTLCVVISNLPAEGLQCDLVATLTPMGETAGMYPAITSCVSAQNNPF